MTILLSFFFGLALYANSPPPALVATKENPYARVVSEYRCLYQITKKPGIPNHPYGYLSLIRFEQPMQIAGWVIYAMGGEWGYRPASEKHKDHWLQLLVAQITETSAESRFTFLPLSPRFLTLKGIPGEKMPLPDNYRGPPNPILDSFLIFNRNSPAQSKRQGASSDAAQCSLKKVDYKVNVFDFMPGAFYEMMGK